MKTPFRNSRILNYIQVSGSFIWIAADFEVNVEVAESEFFFDVIWAFIIYLRPIISKELNMNDHGSIMMSIILTSILCSFYQLESNVGYYINCTFMMIFRMSAFVSDLI